MLRIVHRTGRRREIEDVVNASAVEGLADIVFQEFKPGVVAQVLNIAATSGQQVVYGSDCVPFGQQRVAQMRPRKPAPPVTMILNVFIAYSGIFDLTAFVGCSARGAASGRPTQ